MVKPIAFYLPQYHRIPENDEWWGPGFTEWTNVRKARPNWEGHLQPHVPAELGYYDLANVDVQREQVALAKRYGIYGFCYYHYWFAGRRVLERPVEQLMKARDIEMPFCVCWANENWTRTWDGLDKHVLLAQKHSPQDDEAFLRALLPTFRDSRYIKVDGAPMLLVYRVDLFPDAQSTAKRWRQIAVAAGFPGLHLCAVQFYGITDPRPWGFDAAVEFPPHQLIGPENGLESVPPFTNPEFRGTLVDYVKVAAQAMARPDVDYERYRGVMPSWDNTARRQNASHTFVGATPLEYQYWLRRMIEQTRVKHRADRQFLFINAWNEWGEGCHLEPDQRYGHTYLEATRSALEHDFSADALLDYVIQGRGSSREIIERGLAYQRSMFALSQLLREKNLKIAALEEAARSRRMEDVRGIVWEAAKREARRFPGTFALLKGLRDRLRPGST